ncbi:MAG: RNA-binding protein [Bacilli bacterium]
MEGRYQHFHPDEHPFIDRVLDWVSQAEERSQIVVSPFLTPREQNIVTTIVGTQLPVFFSSGFKNGERSRAIIAPSWYVYDETDFELVAYRIHYRQGFGAIEHRQVLGTLMSAGIDRKWTGDILISESEVYVVLAAHVASYIRASVDKIGGIGVEISEVAIGILPEMNTSWTEETGFISSLRLDCLVSEMYNVSRAVAQEAIRRGHIKCDHREETRTDAEVVEGSVISFVKKGRRKFHRQKGLSKSKKIIISYGKLVD